MVQELPRTLKQAIRELPESFLPDRAGDAEALIQISTIGPEPGNWTVSVSRGTCTVYEGSTTRADIVIHTPSDVWLGILRREVDPFDAFTNGDFSYEGDTALLVRFGNWFEQLR
jgi:putative sterol carrier protein